MAKQNKGEFEISRRKFLKGLGLAVGAIFFNPSSFAQDSSKEIISQADQLYNERFNLPNTGDFKKELEIYKPKMENSISLYEKAWSTRENLDKSTKAHIANRLSQLNYELTTYFDEEEKIERLLEEGKEYGFESLRLDPWFKSWEGDYFEKALDFVNDPSALLWTANNWGSWFDYHPIQGLINIGKVKDMYERGIEVDESYWGGSPHNALGALLVTTPSLRGGDLQQGKEHLEKAIEINSNYLENWVVYSEYWGFTYNYLGDKNGVRERGLKRSPFNGEKFIRETSDYVLEARIGKKWPFWNREAKKEASILLEKMEDFL